MIRIYQKKVWKRKRDDDDDDAQDKGKVMMRKTRVVRTTMNESTPRWMKSLMKQNEKSNGRCNGDLPNIKRCKSGDIPEKG